jgi:hypothetical protein
MSETYAVPIDDDWSSVSFDHEFINVLRSRNMEVEFEELFTVGTLRHGSDESSSYIMAKISHLQAPLDTVDVVDAERKTTYVCGCPGFFNHCYDADVGAKVDDCRHCERAKEQSGEIQAENQATLL